MIYSPIGIGLFYYIVTERTRTAELFEELEIKKDPKGPLVFFMKLYVYENGKIEEKVYYQEESIWKD